MPPRPQPSASPIAAKLRTCSVQKLAEDPRLMELAGAVVRADTGEQLYGFHSASAQRTGSVLKVLTASAAIAVLGADFQITTRVVDGSTAGSIVLVGSGDATLSAMPAGTESVYAGAPKLSSLAASVISKYSAAHPGPADHVDHPRRELLEPLRQVGLDLEALRADDRLPLGGDRAPGRR